MDSFPKITVVTVAYNAVKEIEKTILSVINQDYPNFEYIVIDGASKDGTIDVIKKYENKISLWISEPDKGIYDAMNKGIDKAIGEWILFMNAGDYFYSDKVISNIFSHTFDYTLYDVIYGDAEFRLKSFAYVIEAMDSTPERFMPFSHQAAFTRTSKAKQFKYDTQYKIAADTEFFLRLMKQGSVYKHISIIVCSYDASEGLSVHNEVKRARELVDMQIQHGAKPSAYYRNFIRDAQKKQLIRKLLPTWLWNKIREYKLKKYYGTK